MVKVGNHHRHHHLLHEHCSDSLSTQIDYFSFVYCLSFSALDLAGNRISMAFSRYQDQGKAGLSKGQRGRSPSHHLQRAAVNLPVRNYFSPIPFYDRSTQSINFRYVAWPQSRLLQLPIAKLLDDHPSIRHFTSSSTCTF